LRANDEPMVRRVSGPKLMPDAGQRHWDIGQRSGQSEVEIEMNDVTLLGAARAAALNGRMRSYYYVQGFTDIRFNSLAPDP
jgi:hypothetical protein